MAQRRLIIAALALVTGCTRDTTSGQLPATVAPASVPATAAPTTAVPTTPVPTTTAPTTTAPTTAPTTNAPPTAASTTAAAVATAPPATAPASATRYVVPVADVAAAGWSSDHHDYPATDVFVACGATIVSPVDGTLLEVRRVDEWDAAVDDPATRGGKSIAILGTDGVRYYLAHFDSILDGLEPGVAVAAGDELGAMGRTGRAGACHVHVAISPPCPTPEWWVRRGVVWPYRYLDAWRDGEQLSPVPEVIAWSADHPDACATPP